MTQSKTPKKPIPVHVKFRVDVPWELSPGEKVYLRGNLEALGAWDRLGPELQRLPSGQFTTDLELPAGSRLEFKVTRGDWTTVETTAFGHEVPNRAAQISGATTLQVRVSGWRDQHLEPARPEPIQGEVRLHEFPSRALKGKRRVWVYRPPRSAGDGPFPLLMCLDGQNVFRWGRAVDSMPHSWSLDVIADRLIREGKIPPLVIGAVANGPRRFTEYTPWVEPMLGGGGQARRTYTALRDDIIPAIQDLIPVKTDPESTGILGSSLGGLFSFWAVLQEPSIFNRAAAISPTFFWAHAMNLQYIRTRKLQRGLRLWVDMGTNEIAVVCPDSQKIYEQVSRQFKGELEGRGFPPGAVMHYEEVPGASHNEADWSARSGRVLEFLYPREP